ncbi:MAG: class I SAM-dependent methyltransferase [Holosporaceae bacterium]|jgi:SAM-dependent methyltransferase|nr:class I SAM-dependent methyltransferase [Holosporaceae bacterium]
MKSTDISSLDVFYETDAGKNMESEMAIHISNSLRRSDTKILALGFCANFFEQIRVSNLFYAIPNGYPQVHWPKIRPFKTVVVDEAALPFSPDTLDCIVAVHFMEFSTRNNDFLKEAFRVLKIGGKLMTIAVNGGGIQLTGSPIVRRTRNQVKDIVHAVSNESFMVTELLCFGAERCWRHTFEHVANAYEEIFVQLFSFMSSVVMLTAEKTKLLPESVRPLEARCETA